MNSRPIHFGEVPRNRILTGDALVRLRQLPDACVDCVITSPPYYALRDYDADGQLGLEATVDDWVTALVAVFTEVHRVLKPTGAFWLNLGDSYSRHPRYGAPPKSLLLAPERLLLALACRGWVVRNKVVWAKPNPMPTSVTDRLATTHEVVYFLVRSPQYVFDLDAIREPHRSAPQMRKTRPASHGQHVGPLAARNEGLRQGRTGLPGHPLGKNPGDCWTIAPHASRGPHPATFPEELVRRPLLATCPSRVCASCGAPWRPLTAVAGPGPGCDCGAGHLPGLALDPFAGTGTVAAVAQRYGRDWLGIELNAEYAQLARERLGTGDERELGEAA